MKLIVAGGRLYNDEPRVYHDLNIIHANYEELEIVTGLAKGPDTFGKNWAIRNGILYHEFPANWNKFGKSAGYIRNKKMAEFADGLLAYWDGDSRGTMNMINVAHEHGLAVAVVHY